MKIKKLVLAGSALLIASGFVGKEAWAHLSFSSLRHEAEGLAQSAAAKTQALACTQCGDKKNGGLNVTACLSDQYSNVKNGNFAGLTKNDKTCLTAYCGSSATNNNSTIGKKICKAYKSLSKKSSSGSANSSTTPKKHRK